MTESESVSHNGKNIVTVRVFAITIEKRHIPDSFRQKESKLLKYVHNRNLVDVDKAEMDFSVYEMDVLENQIRIPKLRELYERKRAGLREFQNGKDLWKNDRS